MALGLVPSVGPAQETGVMIRLMLLPASSPPPLPLPASSPASMPPVPPSTSSSHMTVPVIPPASPCACPFGAGSEHPVTERKPMASNEDSSNDLRFCMATPVSVSSSIGLLELHADAEDGADVVHAIVRGGGLVLEAHLVARAHVDEDLLRQVHGGAD